jgi:hypothetical protein
VFAAGGFEAVRDFDASSGDRFVQSKDKVTGLPLWSVEVIDADPEARTKTVKVKVAAQTEPVLPPASCGAAVRAGGVHRAHGDPVCEPGGTPGVLAQGDRGPRSGPPGSRGRGCEGRGGVSAGYTYTTIRSQPDDRIRIDVLVYPDDAVRIRVCGLDEDKPQFWIAYGDVDVTFLPTSGQITETDARIARELPDKAAIYAAEVERLHAEHEARAAADTAA